MGNLIKAGGRSFVRRLPTDRCFKKLLSFYSAVSFLRVLCEVVCLFFFHDIHGTQGVSMDYTTCIGMRAAVKRAFQPETRFQWLRVVLRYSTPVTLGAYIHITLGLMRGIYR